MKILLYLEAKTLDEKMKEKEEEEGKLE